MNRIYGVDKAYRINIRWVKRPTSKSRNTRTSSKLMSKKFGVKIPNNVKEALLLDRINGDSKWADVIKREMDALENLGVWKFHSRYQKML